MRSEYDVLHRTEVCRSCLHYKISAVRVSNGLGSFCSSDSLEAIRRRFGKPYEAILVPKKWGRSFPPLRRTQRPPVDDLACLLEPGRRPSGIKRDQQVARQQSRGVVIVGVVLPILPGWWEHLPIAVVVQMLDGRYRNRGRTVGAEALQFRESGRALSEKFEVSQWQSSSLQSAHPPTGRVSSGPTFLPSDS